MIQRPLKWATRCESCGAFMPAGTTASLWKESSGSPWLARHPHDCNKPKQKPEPEAKPKVKPEVRLEIWIEPEWCKIFKLGRNCTRGDIRAAYRGLAKQLHPDTLKGLPEELQCAASQRLTQVNDAYKRAMEEVSE